MLRIERLLAFTVSLVATAWGMTTVTPAAEITTRALPRIDSEASVASCGDRVVILSQRRLLSVTRDGAVQPMTSIDRAVFVFPSGGRCLVIDATRGIVDVSTSLPKVVRAISGVLPDTVTAAAQSSDDSIWFGIEGTPQLGVIDVNGVVRYFDVPEDGSIAGTLRPAELRLPPALSATLQFTRDAQLLSASQRYVWALRVSTPPNSPSYAIRFDPVTRAYQRLPLGTEARFAGLAALSDDLAVILTSDDRVLVADPQRINLQWTLPGTRRYVAPPRLLNLVAAVPDGADIVSLKDAALWHFSRARGVIELKGQFPGRPSWLTALPDRLMAVNTDAAELMTVPL